MRNADSVHRHFVDCCLKCSQKFCNVELLNVHNRNMIHIFRNRFRIEFNWVSNSDGEITVGAQIQLGIIEIIEVVDWIWCTEGNILDLLKINKIYLLGAGWNSAKTQAVKGLLNRFRKSSIKHRRSIFVIYFIVARFRGIINNFAAIGQDHELIDSHFNQGTVTDKIG